MSFGLIQLRLLYGACVDESTIGVSLSGEVACFLRAGGVAAGGIDWIGAVAVAATAAVGVAMAEIADPPLVQMPPKEHHRASRNH